MLGKALLGDEEKQVVGTLEASVKMSKHSIYRLFCSVGFSLILIATANHTH